MWGVAAAVCEATSGRSTRGLPRDADGALRDIRRVSTAAPLRAVRLGGGTGANTVAKYGNIGGPHFAQANACPKKRAAGGEAKGWRSPSPTWRQRGQASRPEGPPANTQEKSGEEMVVERP